MLCRGMLCRPTHVARSLIWLLLITDSTM